MHGRIQCAVPRLPLLFIVSFCWLAPKMRLSGRILSSVTFVLILPCLSLPLNGIHWTPLDDIAPRANYSVVPFSGGSSDRGGAVSIGGPGGSSSGSGAAPGDFPATVTVVETSKMRQPPPRGERVKFVSCAKTHISAIPQCQDTVGLINPDSPSLFLA